MNPGSTDNKGSQPGTSDLANRLMSFTYREVFQAANEDVLDAIWNGPGAQEALATLALDPKAPDLARFLAAEIIFYRQAMSPSEEQKRQLAAVYAKALAGNFTGMANTWGLPDVVRGLAGEHFVDLGEAAIPALATLLDDTKRVYYAGSQEPTLANSYGYRVKDLAAFYIGKIRNVPFPLDEDPAKRDQDIAKLKGALK
jgi:hypothetical protein